MTAAHPRRMSGKVGKTTADPARATTAPLVQAAGAAGRPATGRSPRIARTAALAAEVARIVLPDLATRDPEGTTRVMMIPGMAPGHLRETAVPVVPVVPGLTMMTRVDLVVRVDLVDLPAVPDRDIRAVMILRNRIQATMTAGLRAPVPTTTDPS